MRFASIRAIHLKVMAVTTAIKMHVPIIEEKVAPKIVPSEISCFFGTGGASGLTSSIPVVTAFTLLIVAARMIDMFTIVISSLLRSHARRFVARRDEISEAFTAIPISTVNAGPIGLGTVKIIEKRVGLIPRRGARKDTRAVEDTV